MTPTQIGFLIGGIIMGLLFLVSLFFLIRRCQNPYSSFDIQNTRSWFKRLIKANIKLILFMVTIMLLLATISLILGIFNISIRTK